MPVAYGRSARLNFQIPRWQRCGVALSCLALSPPSLGCQLGLA